MKSIQIKVHMLYNNGNIVAGCHHNSCSENNWSTLRSKYEPTNKVTNELEE